MQHTATYTHRCCIAVQHVPVKGAGRFPRKLQTRYDGGRVRPGATHCIHTATHCNRTATHASNTLQHTATHCNTLEHTATHWNTLQHNTSALRTPGERLPSGASKEEFGRIIFENKSALGDRIKVQSTPSAAARGGEAWRRNV